MSRIPAEELERLKREVPLAGLCERAGIELKPRGGDLIGRCPFHEDRTPSFVVTPAKNLWNCLGACGGGGDNIGFVMKRESVSFRHAVEKLRAIKGEAPVFTTRQGREHAILVEPGEPGVELSDAQMLLHASAFYHETFLNEPQAMRYLEQRKCLHPEAVKRFKLGYANRTLGYRVPVETLHGQKVKEQLQRIGIFRKTGHEHLSGCVVIPVFSCTGEVAELYGRRITNTSREAPKHWYLPGPHAGVWNAEELRQQRCWHLCEAAIDALSLWCHGVRNVTWCYGVNGWTPDHFGLAQAVRPDRVTVWHDNDEAGNAAAHTLAQQLEPLGIEVWRAPLRPGTDVNDLVRSTEDPKGAVASSVLHSPRAVAVNIGIMRAFIRLRQMALSVDELVRKVGTLERKYDDQFKIVFDAIRQLLAPPDPPRKRIGFHADDDT